MRPSRAPHACRTAIALVALLPLPARAATQSSPCPVDTTSTGRLCQSGVDALTAFLPVEGLLVSGGNPVPGTAAAIGRLGHLWVTGRVGFARVTVPQSSYDGTTDTVPAEKRLVVPVPRLDIALGLFSKQLPLGTAAVDLLGSAVLIPTGATTRIAVDQNARQVASLALGLGFGFRAALSMPAPKPTVSLSVMKRDMPSIRFGSRAGGDPLQAATSLSAINVRLMVGGRAGLLTLAAGAGLDLYSGTGVVTYADSAAAGGDSTVTVKLSTSRIMTALNAGIEFGPVHLWAEGGLQVGKKTELPTYFELNDPSSSRFYGGAGVALKF
jgi:hypothetical protein